jgi:ATP-binding cassette subfamily F protein 3
MTVLALRDVTLRIAGRPLLDSASMTLDPGRKIGLVGRNGAGKSTMLKAIAGELQTDGGEIFIASRARMGRVKQEAPASDDSLLETVLAADTERASLLAEAETSHDPTRRGEIHDRLIAIGADAAPSRAAMVLAGLGFDAAAQQRSVREFSGGWRMRLSLAGALFQEPDLLLLDEPTNHLDLETREALTVALAQFEGTLVLVSHDRHLLRATTEEFLIVADGSLKPFDGDLDDYRDWLFKTKLAIAKPAKPTKPGKVEAEPVVQIQAAPEPILSTTERKEQKRQEAEARQRASAQKKPIETRIKRLEEKMAKANAPRGRR